MRRRLQLVAGLGRDCPDGARAAPSFSFSASSSSIRSLRGLGGARLPPLAPLLVHGSAAAMCPVAACVVVAVSLIGKRSRGRKSRGSRQERWWAARALSSTMAMATQGLLGWSVGQTSANTFTLE